MPPFSAPALRVATGAQSRAGAARRIAHMAAGIASWIAFAVLAAWQLTGYVPPHLGLELELIGAWAAAMILFANLWVRWNRRIYRRRHRRTSAVEVDIAFAADALGRTIVAPKDLRDALGEIVVTVAAGVKRYELPALESVAA
jgi:hypothetical protein